MEDPTLRQHLDLNMLAGVSTAPHDDLGGGVDGQPPENAAESNGYFYQDATDGSVTDGQLKLNSQSQNEEERALIRKEKARERQRRKRAKDREVLGLPPHPLPRAPKVEPAKRSLAHADETEEQRKDRIRMAARIRQQKHRANVRARRQQELDNPIVHEAYGYHELLPMTDGPNLGYPLNAGLFVNTLLLALAADPALRTMLLRLYSINEEDLPSLEQTLAGAFDQWNHSRYAAHAAAAASFAGHPGMVPAQFDGVNWPGGVPPPPGSLVPAGAPRDAIGTNAVYPGGPQSVPPAPAAADAANPIQQPGGIPGVPGQPGGNYFLTAHNQEPPHFRRQRTATSSARNEGGEDDGEGEDGDDDIDGEYIGEGDEGGVDELGETEGGPRLRTRGASKEAVGAAIATAPGNLNPAVVQQEGDGDISMDIHPEEQQQAEAGGPTQVSAAHGGAQGVDPQEEAHKLWSAFWEARGNAEARARGMPIQVHPQAVVPSGNTGIVATTVPGGSVAGVQVSVGVAGPSGAGQT